MSQPTFTQVTFRGRNDDGNETTATWKQLQGIDWTQTVDTKFRVRFLIDEGNGKAWSDKTFNVYFDLAGGGYTAVGASTAVQFATSTNYTNGADTTEQLTGGSGTFLTDNNGMIQGANGATNTGAIGNYFEVEYCLLIDSAQVSDGQTVTLRVYDGTSAIDAYTDEPAITVDKPTAVVNQSSFRIRTADTETLASTSGWNGISGADASLGYSKTFRIAFEIEETGGINISQAYRLYYSKNSGSYTAMQMIPYIQATSYPTIYGVISDQYAHGDAITTNQVNVSAKTFTNGHGVEYNTAQGNYDSNSVTLNNQCTVLEFAIRIPLLYDNDGYNSVNTTYDFRLYTAGGVPLDAYTDTPRVTVINTAGAIGGCPAETQSKMGVWQDSNDNLYYVGENSEVTNHPVMMKSTDDGVTWSPIDVAGQPTQTDMESVDSEYVGQTIYIGYDSGGRADMFQFNTSDHATYPDQWGDATNGQVAEAIVTGKTENDQGFALVYRSDGTFVAFYRSGTTSEVIKYKIRSSGGTWGGENDLDTVNTIQTGIMAIRGSDSDVIHVFYTTEETVPNTIRHRSLLTNDTLTASEVVYSDAYDGGSGWQWAMNTPVVWDNGTNDYVLLPIIDDSDTYLYTVRITDDGSPETPVQVDNVIVKNDPLWMTSRTPIVNIAVDPSDDTLYLLFADDSTGDIWLYTSSNGGTSWSATPTELNDGLTAEMLIGNIYVDSGGDTVYGYVYADRYGGHNDWIYFDTYVISTGGFTQALAGAMLSSGTIKKSTSKTYLGSFISSGNVIKKTSKDFGGSYSSSGTLLSMVKKLFAGTFSSSGDASKKPSKLLSGISDFSGNLVKKTLKAISGNFVSTGILNALKQGSLFFQSLAGNFVSSGDTTKKTLKLFDGTSLFSGDNLKKTTKSFSGISLFSGENIKKTAKVFVGSFVSSGNVAKKSFQTLLGSFISSGVLTTDHIVGLNQITLTGIFNSSGSLGKKTGKTLLGDYTSFGDLIKKTLKPLSGDFVSSGNISKKSFETLLGSFISSGTLSSFRLGQFFQQSLAGIFNSSGDINKKTSKTLLGDYTSLGSLVKKTSKQFVGNFTSSGSVAKKSFVELLGIFNSSGSLLTDYITGLNQITLSGVFNSSGDIVKRKTLKQLAGDFISSGNISKRISRAFAGVFGSSGNLSALRLGQVFQQALSGIMSSSGDITRGIFKQIGGISIFSGNISKKTYKFFSGFSTYSGDFSKMLKKFFSGEMTSSGNILRKIYKKVLGAGIFSGTVLTPFSRRVIGYGTAIMSIFGKNSGNMTVSSKNSGTLTISKNE